MGDILSRHGHRKQRCTVIAVSYTQEDLDCNLGSSIHSCVLDSLCFSFCANPWAQPPAHTLLSTVTGFKSQYPQTLATADCASSVSLTQRSHSLLGNGLKRDTAGTWCLADTQ